MVYGTLQQHGALLRVLMQFGQAMNRKFGVYILNW